LISICFLSSLKYMQNYNKIQDNYAYILDSML